MNHYQEVGMIVFMFLFFWVIRRTIFAYPLMLLITLFHESGHALATLATGGKVGLIRIFPNGSGLTLSSGGNRILILNAGYLGSVLIGALIYLSSFSPLADYSLIAVGVVFGIISIVWVKDVFTQFFAAVISISLIVLGIKLGGEWELFLIRFFGSCCVKYAFFDMNLYIDHSDSAGQEKSDMVILSRETRIPKFVWAFVWRVVSLSVILYLYKLTFSF